MEILLIGAWIAVILTLQLVSVTAAERIRIGHGEVLLGAFLVLLALRRHARGVDLLLPFAALAIALLFELFLLPEATRISGSLTSLRPDQLAARKNSLDWFRTSVALLELTRALVLSAMFLLSYRHTVKSR